MGKLQDIIHQLSSSEATLVAVSKTRTLDEIKALYDQGQRDFGENRIEELTEKSHALPSDIRWHLIGPLQSRKIKMLDAPIHLFHALDRLKIWRKVHHWCVEHDTHLNALIQVDVTNEDSKHGFEPAELEELLNNGVHRAFDRVNIVGLMAMATNTRHQEVVANEFATVHEFFLKCRNEYFDTDHFKELSMGMSSDYEIALDHGTTMVRIGSLLFGPRSYSSE